MKKVTENLFPLKIPAFAKILFAMIEELPHLFLQLYVLYWNNLTRFSP